MKFLWIPRNWRFGPWPHTFGHYRWIFDLGPVRLLRARERTPVSLGREGMVTVWDKDGHYLGCMGAETWHELIVRNLDAQTIRELVATKERVA